MFRRVGSPDPRLDVHGNTDFRLARQLRKYTKEDPPAQRVKPIPLSVITFLLGAAYSQPDEGFRGVADMLCIAFFFLMRPGEHNDNGNNQPFRLQDVKLHYNTVPVNWQIATDADIDRTNAVSLVFTTQKNGVKGEVISHNQTGDPLTCPVKALVRRVKYLRGIGCSAATPLCTFVTNGRVLHMKPKTVTKTLRAGIIGIDPHGTRLDIKPHEIDSRSLRAGGATALLCAGVDVNIIQLLGRWRSDAMIRYASDMFAAGNYTFNPGWTVPALPHD